MVLIAEKNEQWGSIDIMKNTEIDEMKDFLMDRAKKPRHLYVCHGKAKGLRLYTKAFNLIKHSYSNRLKEEQRIRDEQPLIELIEGEEPPIIEVLKEGDIVNLDDLIDITIKENEESVNIGVEKEE